MDLGIAEKTAVVTGAGGGIGRGIAIRLAQEGVKIAGVARTKEALDGLLEELGGEEMGHMIVEKDLSKEGAANDVHTMVREQMGTVDILINNVGGTLNITDPFCSIDDWRKVWRLNMEVAIEFSNEVIPGMRERKWGRIVNIASISGAENHGPVPYCAAKAAMIAYTRSMGRLLSPDSIIMTAILPGAVFTEGGYWDEASQHRPEHVKKYLEERMASHRFGSVEEISGIAAVLSSEIASFCVGSIVPVDGGQGRTYFGV